MTRLTDSQLVVLSAAAAREDGSILPLPPRLKSLPRTRSGGGAVTKVVDSLIRRGLAERIESDRPAVADLIRISRTGLDAIGAEPDDDAPAEVPPAKAKRKAGKHGAAARARGGTPARAARGSRKSSRTKADGAPKTRKSRADSKQAQALAMLRRREGASGEELQAAFGWQPHTVRGFIAGAVKRTLGLDVTSEKVAGRGRVYRVSE